MGAQPTQQVKLSGGTPSVRRIAILAWKTLLELRRDPVLLRMTFVMPIVLIVILGSAISRDVLHLPLVLSDQDHSPFTRQLTGKIRTSEYFDLVGSEARQPDLRRWLDGGRAKVALTVPPGLRSRIATGEAGDLQFLISGEDPTVASIGTAYASGLIADLATETLEQRLPLEPPPPATDPRARVLFNPDLESKNYMVPAIAIILLMLVTMMLTSMSIVRERETGTLEQLLVTPFRAHELILGKTLPLVAIGIIIFFSAIFAGKAIYGFPMEGSLLLLLAFAVLFVLTMLGSGILVSTITRTQQQALFTTWFIAVFFLLMSGFIFPIENMPRAMQLLTYLDPLRYFVTVIRGILMKAAGVDVLWPQAVALAAFGAAALAISTARFRRIAGG